MDQKDVEAQINQNYERDEKMMILVFAQWCVNQGLDPEQLYRQAYPDQPANQALQDAMELTVSKEESEPIADETLLAILSMFGNEDLAFAVTEAIDSRKKRGRKP